MAGVRSPAQTGDVYWGLDHATAAVTALTDIHSYLVPVDGRIIAWGYQVTTAVVDGAGLCSVGIRVADYDDTTSSVTADSCLVAAVAAGNTVTWRDVNYGNGYAVTAGQHVIWDVLVVADTGGSMRHFIVFRPGS